MTFTTIQNTIKVGTSTGVTLPAKELKRMGIKIGDPLKVTFEPIAAQPDTLASEYADFKKQYGDTLKNLSGR